MKAEIKDGNLIITIPVNATPVQSKTGKTKIVASSHGNQVTGVIVDGKPLVIGLNAYTKN